MFGLQGAKRAARPLTVAWLAVAIGVATITPPVSAVVQASGACRVPRLTGLTFERAHVRTVHAGCRLETAGARLELAVVQTVARQSPSAGQRATRVTVWLNPLCRGIGAYPPAIKEPRVSSGPTEPVSGFFLVGGPLVMFSDPHCRRPAPAPEAGKVVVTDASGSAVAMQTSASGHLVKIRLAPGSYTATGTFLEASLNGVHPERTEQVVIPPGDTVHRDFFLDVP